MKDGEPLTKATMGFWEYDWLSSGWTAVVTDEAGNEIVNGGYGSKYDYEINKWYTVKVVFPSDGERLCLYLLSQGTLDNYSITLEIADVHNYSTAA